MKSYFDLKSDGGSRVMEQVVSKRAEIEENLSGVRWMIAVASGKGGVGKSTLSMQIAAALNGMGHSVCLLDADLNGPSLGRLSGLHHAALVPGERGLIVPRTRHGIGVVSMGLVVPESKAVDFSSVAVGESHTWRATREFATLADFLRGTDWGSPDFLLIDLPPGAERCYQFAQFLGRRVKFVLVTIPSDLSGGVVSRSVDAVEKAGSRILGYVENMSGYHCPETGKILPLFPKGILRLDLPRLGQIRFDPALALNCDRGLTIEDAPQSPVAREIIGVAEGMLSRLSESQ